jgi:F-type H+-transporting ATPase subunit c
MVFFVASGKDPIQCIAAAIAILPSLGACIGQGYATGKLVEALARNPEVESKIRSNFIVGMAITESGAIYGLLISLIILFVV